MSNEFNGKQYRSESFYQIFVKNEFDDVSIAAFITKANEPKICCALEFKQQNLTGMEIHLCHEQLIDGYLVSEAEFEQRHYFPRTNNSKKQCVQIENTIILIDADTTSHLYQLFAMLKKEYDAVASQSK